MVFIRGDFRPWSNYVKDPLLRKNALFVHALHAIKILLVHVESYVLFAHM